MFDQNNTFDFGDYDSLSDITISYDNQTIYGKLMQKFCDNSYIAILCGDIQDPDFPKVCLYQKSAVKIISIDGN